VAPPALTDVRLPPGTLSTQALADLRAAVGADHVDTGDEARVRHARGKSTVDLLRLRAADAAGAPDAVVRPGGHDEVLAVLEACGRHRVAVVPFGGGTSVVGGLNPTPLSATVALDLGRMARLVSVDPVSRVAVLEPGLRAPDAEAKLAEHGMSLGHYPQSFEYASIGGFAATRSSGQFSAGYGRFDDMVVALRVATPAGTIECGRAPRSAAGPDLRQLFLGSEGTFGVITSVSLRVHPVPETSVVEAWQLPLSFVDAAGVVRRLVQDGPVPTMVRLSDELETMVGSSGAAGCLAVLAHEGPPAVVAASRAWAADVLAEAGATALPDAVGEDWRHTRYQAPYLRDALLGTGALAETLETATFWSAVPTLYAAVRDALTASLSGRGTPPVVLCHVSHVYATGASLYFTVVCRQDSDPVAQWQAAKAAASRAILDHGGTITHHHAVGTDHAEAYAEEIGPLGLAALRAVKERLDPAGICNPGVLLGRY
jgi:alkyldihydroxyacetonephosphate synthase